MEKLFKWFILIIAIGGIVWIVLNITGELDKARDDERKADEAFKKGGQGGATVEEVEKEIFHGLQTEEP